MTKFQIQAKNLLIERYDYIEKLSALKFLREHFLTSELSTKELFEVYNSIEQYK